MRYYGSCNITIGTGDDGRRVEGKFNNTSTGRQNMGAAFLHNERVKEVSNADPSRARFNHDLIDIEKYKDQYFRAVKDADYNELKSALTFVEYANSVREKQSLEPITITKDDFIEDNKLDRNLSYVL